MRLPEHETVAVSRFLSSRKLDWLTWQAFERAIERLLICEGFENVRGVGQTNDGGADVIGSRGGKRWLFQVKKWSKRVPSSVLNETLDSLERYRASVPVVVSRSGFAQELLERQVSLHYEGIPLQLWDSAHIVRKTDALPDDYPPSFQQLELREYQKEAIEAITDAYHRRQSRRGLVVMATGLGKTVVAGEALRRLLAQDGLGRVLVLAHTNELVLQLERALWRFLRPSQMSCVWNGPEKPSEGVLKDSTVVVACLNTVCDAVEAGEDLSAFDFVLVDECHHVGASMYETVLGHLRAGKSGGPFLLGLTATPWRPDEKNLEDYFGQPLLTVDMVTGLRNGFLANVDYRMYTDNINWEAVGELDGRRLSPRQVNRTLFIEEWDDAVVLELQKTWKEQSSPRAIVFCGTIDHAERMRDKVNALGFCNAEALFSVRRDGRALKPYERSRILCDFADGIIEVVCVVDIFNEGLDVPDVNIIVFQRVTHSRRIFVQQLGRGLRLAPGKDRVIVLDFVSDIRRFAAGLELKDGLESADEFGRGPVRVRWPHQVAFRRADGQDDRAEPFLRAWLDDVAAIEGADEDAAVLKFPPPVGGGSHEC